MGPMYNQQMNNQIMTIPVQGENVQNQGINPQQKVQELLNSGQMSQQQFEQIRQMAN